jgi:hypothetical protein
VQKTTTAMTLILCRKSVISHFSGFLKYGIKKIKSDGIPICRMELRTKNEVLV